MVNGMSKIEIDYLLNSGIIQLSVWRIEQLEKWHGGYLVRDEFQNIYF